MKSNEGAWSERLSSGKAASGNLGVLGAEGDLEAAFSQCRAAKFKGRHSENSTFFFPVQVQAGFLPHGPVSSRDAAGLLPPRGCGRAASCRAGLQTSAPSNLSAWQQLWLQHGFGMGPCWAVKSDNQAGSAFPTAVLFQPAQHGAGSALWPGSRFHGRFPTPGVCRAVWFGTALSSAPLLSRPKATATFTNQVLPRLSPPWSLRGKAGAAGRPQKGCRRGREDPPLLLPRLKDSPGIRREVHIKSPPYLLLQSVPVSLGSWKGLNQEFSPGETLWGLERQP